MLYRGAYMAVENHDEKTAGLCASCAWARRVAHPRGGAPYWLCGMAGRDPRFPKYPRLPVRECPGYCEGPLEPISEGKE